MPEITIKYNDSKTLKVLQALSELLDFTLSSAKKEKKRKIPGNNVSITPGDPSIDISELNNIFTGKNIDAKELRSKTWQRKK